MRAMIALLATVSLAGADVDRSAIRRVVKRHLHEVGACYEAEGKYDALVVIDFVIAKDGTVKSAAARDEGRPKLQTCLAGVFARMKFPVATSETKIAYPVRIRVSGQ
ncbi:MAG: AgmX/PglI C-terminal domain-containing protein [Kofleriaceae bacterium]